MYISLSRDFFFNRIQNKTCFMIKTSQQEEEENHGDTIQSKKDKNAQ